MEIIGKKIIDIAIENDIIYGMTLEDNIYISFSATHEFDVAYNISKFDVSYNIKKKKG